MAVLPYPGQSGVTGFEPPTFAAATTLSVGVKLVAADTAWLAQWGKVCHRHKKNHE